VALTTFCIAARAQHLYGIWYLLTIFISPEKVASKKNRTNN